MVSGTSREKDSAVTRDAAHHQTAITATFSVPPSEFELGRAMAAAPVSRVEFDQSSSGDELVQFQFRAETTDTDALKKALGEVSSIGTVTRVEGGETESLFQIEWAASIDGDGLIGHLFACDARILGVTDTPDGWQFECRFENGDDLSAFHETCLDDEILVDLLRLQHST